MNRKFRSILAGGALAAVIATVGCAGSVRVGYRSYDPYHRDYHVWGPGEGVYYNQWAVETHRQPSRDYRKLRKNEQQDYWKWRHDHPDHK
jgi:hypothetical protein